MNEIKTYGKRSLWKQAMHGIKQQFKGYYNLSLTASRSKERAEVNLS